MMVAEMPTNQVIQQVILSGQLSTVDLFATHGAFVNNNNNMPYFNGKILLIIDIASSTP